MRAYSMIVLNLLLLNLHSYLDAPKEIGNKLYAAYKTANFTLLAKAVAGRYKRQNKEAEKEATKNAIKMEGPLKERESISPTAARPSVTGMRPRSSSIISR